jgi:hypothetical protein
MSLRLAVNTLVRYNARRHLTLSAVAMQQKVAADPIQQLFVEKVREYATKKKASGGKLVNMSSNQRPVHKTKEISYLVEV